MIVRDLIGSSKSTYPSTIVKLLLGRSVINIFLDKFSNMINKQTTENMTFIDECYRKPSTIPDTKKEGVLKNIINIKNSMKIDNWDYPTSCKTVEGPYLHDREIIFFNPVNKLLLIFTYYPLHNIVKNKAISDILVRELKSYVYDNISENVMNTVRNSVDHTLDLKDLMSHKSLTSRFTNNENDIIRITNIFDNYYWEIFKKSLFKDNKGEL